MVAVGDHVHVRCDPVEDGYVVRREGADAAVATLAKILATAFEARHQLTHRGSQVIGKFDFGLVLVVVVAVRIGHCVGADHDRYRPALHAWTIHSLGAVLPVDVGVIGQLLACLRIDNRRAHQLDVQHRRIEVTRCAIRLVDVHLTLEQAPERPHVLVHRVAVGILCVDLRRMAEHGPVLRRPRAKAEHDDIALDVAHVRSNLRHRAIGHVVAGDLDARVDAHAVVATLLREPRNRLSCTGISADLLVQHHVDVVGLEVRPDVLQEFLCISALVDLGGVADARLARLQLLVVARLVRFAGRDVADLLEAERDRIARPHVDGVTKDRVDRLGHVKVAHASACNTRSTGAGTALVDDDDVLARSLPRSFQRHRQMPRSGQAVYAGAHDYVAHRCRKRVAHAVTPLSRNLQDLLRTRWSPRLSSRTRHA